MTSRGCRADAKKYGDQAVGWKVSTRGRNPYNAPPMKSHSTNAVRPLFELLDRWRHFPDYQLERRADIFFALYLPEILQAALDVAVGCQVIPEFPIKREDSWRSTKVDYFLMSEDRSRAFLVELKTDMGSRRASQDEYLALAKQRGLNTLLDHVAGIAARSPQQAKYVHLLVALEGMNLLRLPSDLPQYAFPKVRPGIKERLRAVEVLQTGATIEIVYVQPGGTGGDRVISFESVAGYLSGLDDPLARTFAKYVEGWIEPAASRAPTP